MQKLADQEEHRGKTWTQKSQLILNVNRGRESAVCVDYPSIIIYTDIFPSTSTKCIYF